MATEPSVGSSLKARMDALSEREGELRVLSFEALRILCRESGLPL